MYAMVAGSVVYSHTHGNPFSSRLMALFMDYILFFDSIVFVWFVFIIFGLLVRLIFILKPKFRSLALSVIALADLVYSLWFEHWYTLLFYGVLVSVVYFLKTEFNIWEKYGHTVVGIWLGFFAFHL